MDPHRLVAPVLTALLALGALACDAGSDTVDGEPNEAIETSVPDAGDDPTEEFPEGTGGYRDYDGAEEVEPGGPDDDGGRP